MKNTEEEKKERKAYRKKLIAEIMNEIKQNKNKNKNKNMLDTKGYITFKRIHQGYTEMLDIQEKMKQEIKKGKVRVPHFFGKWQYFFIRGDKIISMIQLKSFKPKRTWDWEIFAFYDKRLFEDTLAFRTKAKALETVDRLFII